MILVRERDWIGCGLMLRLCVLFGNVLVLIVRFDWFLAV